jgi:hypothetical protein
MAGRRKQMASLVYRETFDEGPGGWLGWGFHGPEPLELKNSIVTSWSPWWIDYNHAPPGGGYLHLPFVLYTHGPLDEPNAKAGGPNRFIEGGFPTDFTNARLTLRLRGELETRGANLALLVQGYVGDLWSNWVLSGRPFQVGKEWSEQTVVVSPDPELWTSMGSRHDRTARYGKIDIPTLLKNVNGDIILVFFPLNIEPMGPIAGDKHILRPEMDYHVWRSKLPEGYIQMDEVKIEYPER